MLKTNVHIRGNKSYIKTTKTELKTKTYLLLQHLWIWEGRLYSNYCVIDVEKERTKL